MHTTDAQLMWKDFQEHTKSSSRGASEKRRLTQYVTNTISGDYYKGTTEQFILHFNEQFRQLEEISEESEHFLPQIKLQLLQNAVRPVNDLRIVYTLDEFQSITTSYGRCQLPPETPDRDPYMGIDTPSDEFYNNKTNQSGPPMSARHKLQPRLLRSNPNTKPNTLLKKPARQKWTGPIYLPGHIYKLLSKGKRCFTKV